MPVDGNAFVKQVSLNQFYGFSLENTEISSKTLAIGHTLPVGLRVDLRFGNRLYHTKIMVAYKSITLPALDFFVLF